MSRDSVPSHYLTRWTPREHRRDAHSTSAASGHYETDMDVGGNSIAGIKARVHVARGYGMKIPNPASRLSLLELDSMTLLLTVQLSILQCCMTYFARSSALCFALHSCVFSPSVLPTRTHSSLSCSST